jgi:hypothetical protein
MENLGKPIFEALEQVRKPRITDYRDRLLLIKPLRIRPFTHPNGMTVERAVDATLWVLDGDGAPGLVPTVTVMQKLLAPRLADRRSDAPPLLTWLRAVPHIQRADSLVWQFHSPHAKDRQLAKQLLAEVGGDPFAATRTSAGYTPAAQLNKRAGGRLSGF